MGEETQRYNVKVESDDSLEKELKYLKFQKNNLLKLISFLDEKKIEIKEELIKRKEKKEKEFNILNCMPDEGI